MKLFECIDGLLVGTKYLEGNKKYIVGAVACVLAAAIMGIVYLANGGFPEINLIFVSIDFPVL